MQFGLKPLNFLQRCPLSWVCLLLISGWIQILMFTCTVLWDYASRVWGWFEWFRACRCHTLGPPLDLHSLRNNKCVDGFLCDYLLHPMPFTFGLLDWKDKIRWCYHSVVLKVLSSSSKLALVLVLTLYVSDSLTDLTLSAHFIIFIIISSLFC